MENWGKWIFLLVWLASTGWGQEDGVQKYIQKLSDPDVSERLSAVQSLADLGKKAVPAIPALIKSLADDCPDVREIVIQALVGMREMAAPVVPTLIKLLSDDCQYVRASAARVLAGMPEEAGSIVPALIQMLSDTKSKERIDSETVIRLLGNIGEKAEPAIPILSQILQNNQDGEKRYITWESNKKIYFYTPRHVRIYAIKALGWIGKKAVPTLIQSLEDSNTGVVVFALKALDRISKEANIEYQLVPAIPTLIKIFRARNRYVVPGRLGYDIYMYPIAASILERLGTKSVPALIQALTLPDVEIREETFFVSLPRESPPLTAADLLTKMGEVALPELEKALQDEKYAQAHGEIQKIIQNIKEKPNEPKPEKKVLVRQRHDSGAVTVYVFETSRIPSILKHLLAEGELKNVVTKALKEFGKEALPFLEKALQEEEYAKAHPHIREIIKAIHEGKAEEKE